MRMFKLMVGVFNPLFLKVRYLSVYTIVLMHGLNGNQNNFDGSTDHREGLQELLEVGVDQVAGFGQGPKLT
jgi:hypothetical protein